MSRYDEGPTSSLGSDFKKQEMIWYDKFIGRVPEVRMLATKDLLWTQFCGCIKEIERDAIRRQIGEKIISENEELHCELQSLIEILYDYRGETIKSEKQVEWERMSFQGDTVFKKVKLNIQTLTEMLKKQHDMFIESDKEKQVLSFILNESRPPSRPETPRPSSLQSSHSSNTSSSSGFSAGLELSEVEKKLNFLSIEEVLCKIREAFNFEKEILQEDIEYIRELIDEEFSYNKSLQEFKVPSILDLKALENKLQEKARISTPPPERMKSTPLKPLQPPPITSSTRTATKEKKPPSRSITPSIPSTTTSTLPSRPSSTVSKLKSALRQSRELSGTNK
ncbi:hypothetical protein C9374_010830 [Naegleria lovaniensis]|uniref:Uncharacterized protein n=1 Tax=Naegleria lovaniensis TaxID=51637 RepID=A0AA88GF03_NAELO|nr:uncharacterized protein C9374_010830 [Naegleria lovaniensis]KAG2374260.1 hypothetical protein C9374_010830 [Naegleria lovaniensis]